jgi:hypothetical protein
MDIVSRFLKSFLKRGGRRLLLEPSGYNFTAIQCVRLDDRGDEKKKVTFLLLSNSSS